MDFRMPMRRYGSTVHLTLAGEIVLHTRSALDDALTGLDMRQKIACGLAHRRYRASGRPTPAGYWTARPRPPCTERGSGYVAGSIQACNRPDRRSGTRPSAEVPGSNVRQRPIRRARSSSRSARPARETSRDSSRSIRQSSPASTASTMSWTRLPTRESGLSMADSYPPALPVRPTHTTTAAPGLPCSTRSGAPTSVPPSSSRPASTCTARSPTW